MISTSSHNDWQSDKYRTYSISGNRGKDANYQGKCYPELAPKLSFWKVWHNNIGKISEEENNRYYVQEYWNQVLSKLDPEKVFRDLDYSVLLCYEPNTEFLKDITKDKGYIIVDSKMKTNIDYIFACGDIIKKDVYQLTTAVGEATTAAINVKKEINS